MRGVLLLVVCVGVTGCSNRTAENENAVNEITVAFDVNDRDKTERWLRTRLAGVESAYAKKNDLALAKEMKELKTDLASHKGKSISWELPVAAVGDGKVSLQPILVSTEGRRPKIWFVVSAVHGSQPNAELLRTYDGPEFGSLPIGGVISERAAAQLGKGGHVHVNGSIARFDIDGYEKELFINAVLVRATVK